MTNMSLRIVLACIITASSAQFVDAAYHGLRRKLTTSNVLITEIMYNPDACDDNLGEWIEIYNAGSTAVNLQDWTIKDASTSIKTLSSFNLVPGGYYILGRTTNGCGGLNADSTFTFNINNSGGDTLTLKDNLGNTVDEVSYGGNDADPGYTLERKADSSSNPIDTNNSNDWQQGSSGGSPRAGYSSNVLITEIMYNPTCTNDDGEWIELYNRGTTSINLGGWKIRDATNNPEALINFDLAPGAYFILAKGEMNACGGFAADDTFPFGLNNAGDTLTLEDNAGNVVDVVQYTNTAAQGKTLVRKSDGNGSPIDTGSINDWEEGLSGGNPRAGYTSLVNVLITEIMYDPTACADSTGEWVELYNAGTASANLAGWIIKDSSSSETSLNNVVLAAGGYYILGQTIQGCTGSGWDSDKVFSFNLNNAGGDSVILKNDAGYIVDQVTYASNSAAPGKTFVRKADGAGKPIDTDSNSDWEEGVSGGTPRAGYTSPGGPAPSPTPQPSHQPTPTPPPTPTPLPTPSPGPTTPMSNTDVKVMTYNILKGGAGLTEWKDIVKSENADIVVFTEVGNWDDNNNALLNQYLTEFNSHFSSETNYVGSTVQGISIANSANAIMSRFPIVQTVQLTDNELSSDSAHDLMIWKLDVGNNKFVYVIGIHLKCCGGTTNDNRRENTMKNLIAWIDANTNPTDGVMLMGDFNSISPADKDPSFPGYHMNFEPRPGSTLGDGPLRMLLDSNQAHASNVHTFKDAFREANPHCGSNSNCCADTLCDSGLSTGCPERGYTYVGSGHDYDSRIDFIIVNQHVSITGPATAGSGNVGQSDVCTASDHLNVDAIVSF